MDDGSTDNTDEVMADYIAKDARFQYHHRPKDRLPGGNAARNYGFEVSTGHYVNWLDSDDLFSEQKVLHQICKMEKEKTDLAICQWAYLENSSLNDIRLNSLVIKNQINTGQDILYHFGKERTYFPSHVYLINRDVITISGLWNEWLSINQDGEFFARVLIYAKNVSTITSDDCYVLYRRPIKNNNSRIFTEIKARHYILSWHMIQSYLKVIEHNRFEALINYSRTSMVKRLMSNYGHLLPKDEFYYKYKYGRIKRKFKSKIRTIFKVE